MNLLADLLIVVAAIFTAVLGYFLALPTPAAPDRAGLSVALPLLQTPRWICLTLLMGMCVARGAFTWPSTRAGQHFVVFTGQVLLGLASIVCTMLTMDRTAGSPHWIGKVAQLPPFILPLVQMAFAAWFLNPALRDKLDPGTVRTVTNRVLAGFGLLIVCFGVLAIVALWKDLAQDARNRAQNPLPKKTEEVSREVAEEQKFRALTSDAPISEWLKYTSYGTSDERKKIALEALARRPRLIEEMTKELASENWDIVNQALYAIELLPPAPPAGLVVPFQEVGQRITEGLQDAGSSRWSPEQRNRILANWSVCASAYMAAARGLQKTSEDTRPSLRA